MEVELPSLKDPGQESPGQGSRSKKRSGESPRQESPRQESPSTARFFPTTLEKLNRKNVLLDFSYDIDAITTETTCMVSIVSHLHGHIPVEIKIKDSIVKDADFIYRTVPNSNKLSTRLMAPAGLEHLEHYEGDEACPIYHSSLRFIYVSRMRMFKNLQCLPQVHFSETEKEKFLSRDYYNADYTGFSEKGLADLGQFPDFKEYIYNPQYCQYFPEKSEYIEKVFRSGPSDKDEDLFGIYIDVAIITAKIGDPTKSTVTVKTFILSNKSEVFSRASIAYINQLLGDKNPEIKEELEDFIRSGTCKLSTIIEAISLYIKYNHVLDGNTKMFFTDLACSVYKTFDHTPRKIRRIRAPSIDEHTLDKINEERTASLFAKHGIPQESSGNYLNEDGTGYFNGLGDLYLIDINRAKFTKVQAEEHERDKIVEILEEKLRVLRMRLAAGSLIFNKRHRHTMKRQRIKSRIKSRTMKGRRIKRRTMKGRRTNKKRGKK